LFNRPALLQRLDAVILMSEVQRPFFESHGVSPHRIHVVHHGVDCDFFRPAEPGREAPFHVVSVGNYRRNFPLLREVCERLKHEPGIRFKIVGPDARRSIFADLGNVDFLSNVSDEELRSLYQQGSCMLMTVDAATANNALLEALACGLPVVSEDVGGIPEYTGAAAALLQPARDAGALAASILSLRANPALRHSMASAARARALELDWPIVARNTAAIYQRLIATAPK
jgi:glycosyltransferase involved in cell wall biosynthesis